EGAEVGLLKRRPRARQPVAVQAAVVHPFLEIDAHGAECRQRPAPVVARVDVLGADGSGLSDGFGHLCLLGCAGSFPVSRRGAPLARRSWDGALGKALLGNGALGQWCSWATALRTGARKAGARLFGAFCALRLLQARA